jgi:hypothetical protein
MDVKTNVDYVIRIAVVLIPLIWKATSTWRSDRGSGKRLHFVVWKAEKTRWINPKIPQFLADAFRRSPKAQSGHNEEAKHEGSPSGEIHTAELFIWNAGVEDITSDDVYDNHPLYIDLTKGEIEDFRVKLSNHDVILKDWSLQRHSPEKPLVPSSAKIITAAVKHWPPNSGVVVECKFKAPSLRAATFSVCGPIRHLRERKFLGRIWRIDLRKADRLPTQLAWATFGSWASGTLFLVSLAVYLFHSREWTIGTTQYHEATAIVIAAEVAYFILSDIRNQIGKKICPSLRYWLPQIQ